MWSRLKEWIGWAGSWALFWPGHATSWIIHWLDFSETAVRFIYPVYNWFMITSGDVQDWGGGYGAWEDFIDVELEEKCATCGNEVNIHKMDCPIAKGDKE